MMLVAALSTDGSFISEKGKGGIEDASLFYTTSNQLQKLAFDAYRHNGAVMVVVVPVPKQNGNMTIMTLGDKPLAFMQIQDEILIFDDEEQAYKDEHAMWLEERHYERFKTECGLSLAGVRPVNYGLRLAGYLTEEDRNAWAKAQ